jgi:hypothetical protein
MRVIDALEKEMMFNGQSFRMLRQPIPHMVDNAFCTVIDNATARDTIGEVVGRKLIQVLERLLPLLGQGAIGTSASLAMALCVVPRTPSRAMTRSVASRIFCRVCPPRVRVPRRSRFTTVESAISRDSRRITHAFHWTGVQSRSNE